MGAVGVFDSGVGGLSVLREIRRELPLEPLLYVADSGHAPYGDKPEDFVIERSRAIADFLLQQGATSIVVACNTATAAAVDALRVVHALPIVGVEPGIKPAIAATRAGVVGVLTTSRTALSHRFLKLLERYEGSARMLVQPCPGWVERVERGAVDGAETEALVDAIIRPLRSAGADVLVLGCTHYSFLAPVIQRIAGAGVILIDPAPAVARHLRHRLEHLHLLSAQPTEPLERAWTTGSPTAVSAVAAQLCRRPLHVDELPPPFC